MVDPAVTPMTELDLRTPRHLPGGLCFVCGTWVDHETQQAYLVTLERDDGERHETLAHVTCLGEVAHPSSALKQAALQLREPVPEPNEAASPEASAPPEGVPPASLAPKPFTPDGR
ncbi:MAG: hypothetical protein QOE87_1592 [Gaiellales bacterium]|jgi:hypothetical protein|nr:hypothetical protein [Gaiellales bacterium]